MLKKSVKDILKSVHADNVVTRILIPFHREQSNMSVGEARRILQEYSAKPDGSCIVQNEIDEMLIDLQIIIPAYNAERYLCECLNSVISQKTKYSYKAVVIDDGSADKTKEILEKYAGHEQIIPVYQDNRGFSGARNRGLEKLFSKYIMFLDSDDILPDGAISSLMDTAIEMNADIVEGSAYEMADGKRGIYDRYKKRVNGYKGRLKGQPWGKVYKRSIFDNLCFPEGFWFEDSINALIIYPQTENIVVIPDFVYTYRKNPDGISATAKKYRKIIDTYWVTEQLLDDYKTKKIVPNRRFMDALMQQIILNFRRTDTLEKRYSGSYFCAYFRIVNIVWTA